MRRALVLCALALSAQSAACSKQQSDAAGSGAASASVTASAPLAPPASAPASAGSKTKPPPAAAGEWAGTYDARHYLIEMTKKEGAVREWEGDKGEAHSGKGQLTLRIAEDGTVSGSSSGALGELAITGEFDGEHLRLQLSPSDPEKQPAFLGHLLAERKGEIFKGRIQASSGDSLTVRDAPVELRPKTANPPKE